MDFTIPCMNHCNSAGYCQTDTDTYLITLCTYNNNVLATDTLFCNLNDAHTPYYAQSLSINIM